jgi:Protein of unknown function (DUF1236)
MTNRFMVSVAALALIAGTGLASAQGMNKEPGGATTGPSGGAAMQHSVPADAPAGSAKSEPSEKGGMKSSQTEQKSPGAMKNERAEDNVKGGSTTQRAEDRDNAKGSNANQRADESTKSGTKAEGRENMKAEGRDQNNMKAEGRDGDRNNNMKADGKNSTERTQTTGQAGANAKLSTEQRTKITTVIRNEHVAPVNNVNFSISIGTRVPREGVSFHRLPSEVVTFYPEWRGYEYILVRDQIIVIDPATYEIVAVLDA